MTTNEKPSDEVVKARCDLVVQRAAVLMTEGKIGAPVEMIVDRFITFATAQIVASFGRERAIAALNLAAISVEQGVFDHIDPATKAH